jgi:long-chain acyl-CoA synthetase
MAASAKSGSLSSILRVAAERWGEKPFVWTRSDGRFRHRTFADLHRDVTALAASLIEEGLGGKHVMVFGENSYQWLVADLAVSAFTGVSVAMGATASAIDLSQAIASTDISAVFYSDALADVASSAACGLEIPFYSLGGDLKGLVERGASLAASRVYPQRRNGPCKVYYTSGTTAAPKAVLLSEANILAGVASLHARAPLDETDSSYLFLPLSHTYGGIYNAVYALVFGVELYLCSDTKLLVEELAMVRPTILCAVPRVLERLLGLARVTDDPAEALRRLTGGRLRYLFCSGAPWLASDRQAYIDAGLNLMEAYALTETASSLAIPYSGQPDVESVGVVLEGVEVAIDGPDADGFGEILVRGPNVCLGYYGDAAATRAAIDGDGFLHTGDIGRLGESGSLYLRGRKGRIFKASSGEFVNPELLEGLLMEQPGVERAQVVNDGGYTLACLSLSRLAAPPQRIIDEVNGRLPHQTRIDRVSVI